MGAEKGRSGWIRRGLEGGEDVLAPEPSPATGSESTFFGDGCEIQGDLVLDSSIRIDGEFRGSITSKDTVEIAEDATVEGRIQARIVVIHGAVAGDVEASREVVLAPTGRLHGDVETPSLEIQRGAFFNGKTKMFRPQASLRPSAPVTQTRSNPTIP